MSLPTTLLKRTPLPPLRPSLPKRQTRYSLISSSPPLPRSDIRICFLGDSFTTGAGDDTLLGFPGRLCSALRTNHNLDITSYNLGIRRDTSADILARWEREVAARLEPSQGYEGRLVFCFGTNDNVFENGERRVRTQTTLVNAKDMLMKAKQKWPTVMLGPPWTSVGDVDEGNRVLSRELEGLCGEIGVPFLSLYERLEGNGVWAREAEAGDGIHPGAGGYGLIAEAVEGWEGWEGFVREGK